jgi:endoribonuclease LACTB2
VSDIAPAASVLLTRGRGSPQVFVVRRAAALRFFGGFVAFPGGRVDSADAAIPPDPQRTAAARELFEETGVLIARRADGSFPAGGAELVRLRRDLLDERLSFADVLRSCQATIHAEDFQPACHLVTPPFTPNRFDTRFFVAALPWEAGQEAEVWPGELADGRWETAVEMLNQWQMGSELVAPPTVTILEVLRGQPIHRLPELIAPLQASLDAGTIPPIYFAPGVRMIPLRCHGLPPSAYTNAFLVGREKTYLLDPGPTDSVEQKHLFDILDAEISAGRSLTAIVLTHHHPDHIGAAAVCAERYQIPVWAHLWTAEALYDKVRISHTLNDGDRLDLGTAPDGSEDWHLRAIHTPGHAPGHLAFYDPQYRLLFAADMVSTLSSIVIAPPEGDIAVYLDSLRRLLTLECRLLLPSHGSPTAQARKVLEDAIEHRRKREAMLLAALSETPQTIADLTLELYKGVPSNLIRLAELQMLAGLQKLQREGRAEPVGDGWRASEPGA